LGFDTDKAFGTGILNFDPTTYTLCDNVRSFVIDEKGGTYSASENWLVLDDSSQDGSTANAIENFNIELRKSETDARNRVSVNGSIQGLETRSYSPEFAISETKYAAASGHWEQIKDANRIYPRANVIATNENITLNADPILSSVAHSPALGIISYSYEYDDRPTNCITGAITESITISDSGPTDVFAQVAVIGRSAGPILQDMSTSSAITREVSIDILMSGNDNCSATSWATMMSENNPRIQTDAIVSTAAASLSSYGQVFKHVDTESWNPRNGRFRRHVGWTASSCT